MKIDFAKIVTTLLIILVVVPLAIIMIVIVWKMFAEIVLGIPQFMPN